MQFNQLHVEFHTEPPGSVGDTTPLVTTSTRKKKRTKACKEHRRKHQKCPPTCTGRQEIAASRAAATSIATSTSVTQTSTEAKPSDTLKPKPLTEKEHTKK